MSRNYAELEQEMITDLAQRTGRDLAQWMAAIDAAGLADKNAIIDWLRPQGMTFAHASWLERIHNNGGRPIYLEQPPRPARPAASTRPPLLEPRHATSAPETAAPTRSPIPATAPARSDPEGLKHLLSKAKAYRPLAEHLVGEISRVLPGVAVTASEDLVVFERPFPLAVLWVSARELRLGLDLGEVPFDAVLLKPKLPIKLPGAVARFTHMLVLTDARQIGAPLLDLVGQSDARANPPPPGA